VSLSNVALRWVLDQPSVAGVIVGARLGYKQHVKDNRRVFSFQLDDADKASIAAVQVESYQFTVNVYYIRTYTTLAVAAVTHRARAEV